MLLETYEPNESGDGEWYTPAFGQNRELPPDRRAEFYLYPLTKREKDDLEKSVTTSGRSRDFMKVAENRQEAKIRRTLEKRIGGFRRVFKPGPNGERVEITDAKDFVQVLDRMDSASAEELRDELISALTDRSVLREGVLGNSPSPSASDTAEKTRMAAS